jgi:hypothetical protein
VALIERGNHHEDVFGYVLITFLVLLGPLAYLAGVDSRVDERSPDRRLSG